MPKKSGEDFGRNSQGLPFYLITFAFFVISFLVFSGAFVWQNYFLNGKLSSSKAQNESLSAEISEKLKSPSVAANRKARNVEKILVNHLYWSKFYKTLENFTLKNVFYKDFSLDIATAKNDIIKAKISGETDSFRDLAKQMAAFGENKDIVNIEFERAEVNKSGKIDFRIGLDFKQSLVIF